MRSKWCFSVDRMASGVIDKVVHRHEDDISATFVHEGWRGKYDDDVMYPWCLEVLDEDGYPHGLIEELYKTTGVYFNGKKKILIGME